MKDDVRINERDERLEWIGPTIKELDIVAETQSSFVNTGTDNTSYS
jgi:hypothetical protein